MVSGKKRLQALAALLTLCMTGCTPGTGPSKETQSQTPEWTQALTSIFSTEAATETKGETTQLASGLVVGFDTSSYKPKEKETELYTPLASSGEFVPSDSYGMVYPYIDRYVYSGENGYSYLEGAKYGLIDEKGQILTAAVYDDIRQTVYEDEDGKRNYYPFYILCCYEPIEIAYGEEEDEVAKEVISRISLVSADGSRFYEGDYRGVTCGPQGILLLGKSKPEDTDGNGHIAGEELDDLWRYDCFTLIDADGEELLTEKDMKLSGHTFTGNASWFLNAKDSERIVVELEDGTYLMDLSGNLICGPYYDISQIKNGMAVFEVEQDEDRFYGIMDTNGNVLMDPIWSYIILDNNGYSMCCLEHYDNENDTYDNEYIIYDYTHVSVSRDVLIEANLYSYGYEYTKEGETLREVYDYDKNLLLTYDPEKSTLMEGLPIMITPHEGEGYTTVTNFMTGAILELKGEDVYEMGLSNFDELESMDWSDHTLGFMFYIYDIEQNERFLYNENLVKKLSCTNREYLSILYDGLTGKRYLAKNDSSGVTVYTTDFKKVTRVKGLKGIYNGRILSSDDWGCRYSTLEGETLFYKKLVTSYDD